MRSFIAVATGILALVCVSFAAPSVVFPKGYNVPEGAQVTGKMVYHSLANSQKTLARGVDVSLLATPSKAHSTLVGKKTPASLVIIPEELAPKEGSVPLTDNSFPLSEMSMTLSTAVVLPGLSADIKEALEFNDVSKYNVRDGAKLDELSYSLFSCGIGMDVKAKDNAFSLNKVVFDNDAARDVLYASSVVCSSYYDNQVTIVDLRSAYTYAKENYGADSDQVQAVEKMIRSIMEFLSGETISFVIASDNDFSAGQLYPDNDFVVVPTRVTATVAKSATEIKSSPDTGIFQITLWFTILVVIVVLVFAVLTCGVGIDIEKDTLLYQTTALRGQPVL